MRWKMLPAYCFAFVLGAAIAFTLPVPAQDWRPAKISAAAPTPKPKPPEVNPDPFNPPPNQTTPVQPQPPVVISPSPVTVNPMVTDREKTWSEILIPNLLNLILGGLGITLSPWMVAIIRRASLFVANRLEARLREKLEDIVDNGGAAVAAEGPKSRSEFLGRVVSYVIIHGRDTLKRLGTPATSPEAQDGIRAIAEKLLARGRWRVDFKEDASGVAEDRIQSLEDMFRSFLEQQKQPK